MTTLIHSWTHFQSHTNPYLLLESHLHLLLISISFGKRTTNDRWRVVNNCSFNFWWCIQIWSCLWFLRSGADWRRRNNWVLSWVESILWHDCLVKGAARTLEASSSNKLEEVFLFLFWWPPSCNVKLQSIYFRALAATTGMSWLASDQSVGKS